MILSLDAGNAWGKWYAPQAQRKSGLIRHVFTQLTTAQYDQLKRTGKSGSDGLFIYNGIPYAVGDLAEGFTSYARMPRGAARYVKGHYDVFLAFVLSQTIPYSVNQPVQLALTFAPQDEDYIVDLLQVASGKYQVEIDGEQYNYIVDEEFIFDVDEPIGGWGHTIFDVQGNVSNGELMRKRVLVMDGGGWTLDVAGIESGQIVPNSLDSHRIGIIELLSTFEREMRSLYRKEFKGVGDLPAKLVEKALRSGHYPYGNQRLEVVELSNRMRNQIANEFMRIFEGTGGAAAWEMVILTGGGAAIVADGLKVMAPQIEWVSADGDPALVQFANAMGAYKLMMADKVSQ